MPQILCIANQKGGVGKTTTAVNLSAALAASGKEILLVDCDPQANATTGVGINKQTLERTLYHGLVQGDLPETLITDTEIQTLKVIPSRIELIGFEVEMMGAVDRERILKGFLGHVTSDFDYIILDCPPALGLLTLNAMTAADALIIPLQCEFYGLEGLGQLIQTIKRVRNNLNPDLKIAGILLTMFDTRTNLSHQVAENAAKYFKALLFKTRIPRNVRLGEAPSFGKPILLYDAASPGALTYLALAREILNHNP